MLLSARQLWITSVHCCSNKTLRCSSFSNCDPDKDSPQIPQTGPQKLSVLHTFHINTFHTPLRYCSQDFSLLFVFTRILFPLYLFLSVLLFTAVLLLWHFYFILWKVVSCVPVEFCNHRPRVSPCQSHLIVKHKGRQAGSPPDRCTPEYNPPGQSRSNKTVYFFARLKRMVNWYCWFLCCDSKWRSNGTQMTANVGNEAFLKHLFVRFLFNSEHRREVLSVLSSLTFVDLHNAQPPETFCARRHAERGCLLCWIYLRINNFYWNHRCYFQSLKERIQKKKSLSPMILPD